MEEFTTNTLIDLIRDYVDKKVEYELACLEVGEDGYRDSHPKERQAMEDSYTRLSEYASLLDYRRR